MLGRPSRPPADRLWEKVDKHPGDGCWVFTGAKNADGYGVIWVAGRTVLAHRLAWELAYGPIPDGMDALHSCDNPPCARLDHLHLGTQQINVEEMVARGRHRGGRGEQHGMAKLTEAQVQAIRLNEGGLSQRALARRFGVGRPTVCHILAARSWAWLEASR